MPRPAVLLLPAIVGLAACTSGSGPSSSPSASVVTSTQTTTLTGAPTPVSSGPTTAATATACPYAGTEFVHDAMGIRLGRVTVLRSGGQVVGCRFYAQQQPGGGCNAGCLAKEKLPGPNQPAVEISTQRYASSLEAHNAFVLRAGTSDPAQTDFAGTTGLCFQTAFDPRDKGDDYACTVNKGPTVVLVRTVDIAHNSGTAAVLRTVLRGV